MKKLVSILLVMSLFASCLFACTAMAETKSATATSKGFGGDIVVTIEMDGDQIVSCTIVGDSETNGIGSKAVEQLPALIVAAQGTEVDMVSGATVSSTAILRAANDALNELKGIEKEEVSFVPGTYEGSALGFGGELVLAVTVSESKIEKIECPSDKETDGIGREALPILISRIVDNQSLLIDTVASATATSNAVISAADMALAQACGDTSALYREYEREDNSNKPVIELSSDIVVVGAGPAGFASSIAASDNGASVILLEKMEFVGGNSAISGGSVNSGCSEYQKARGLEDSFEILYEDILHQGQYENDERLATLYAQNVGQTFDWLVNDLHVEFEDEPYFAAEHTVQRAFKSKSNPLCYSTIQTLKKNALDRGVQLYLNLRADELILDESGAVVGVRGADKTGQRYEFSAKAVILTTGGFGNNKALLSDNLSSCIYYGSVCATGDGLKMATDIGAITQNMTMGKCVPDGFEYAPGLGKSTSNSNKVAFQKGSTILLNEFGERFANELGEREVFADQIRASSIGMNYLFMDQASWDIFLTKNSTFSLDDAEKWFAQNGQSTPVFVRANTIEEVAQAVGIDPAVLQATVDRYNSFVEKGVDEDFGRSALEIPIGEGPYYLIEQKLRFATTLGGLRTSTSMEVYREGDVVIPGLYAAGEIVGGAQGANALVGGNNGWALTSGKIAGTVAAESIK